MLELILDVHLCYNYTNVTFKKAVEKAKLVFVRSRKHIWNNKIGEEWSRAEHFYEGTQCWYLMKHPCSLTHVEACRPH